MTMDGVEDSPRPDWQLRPEPPRPLQPGVAAVSGDRKHHGFDVRQESLGAPSSSIHLSIPSPGNSQSNRVSSLPPLRLDRLHDHFPFNSSTFPASASLPDNSRSLNSTSTSSTTETLDTLHSSQFQQAALQHQLQINIQPPTPGIENLTTMFGSLQTAGVKRSREVDHDEAQQLQFHNSERRIARMRDNSNNAAFAAGNISENRISSTSLFLPSHERSSPPRARSNALSVSQTDTTMTPYPSDGEEFSMNTGFAKLPNLSLRSRKATTNPFSAAQSPAESFDSSQNPNEDYQDTSMVTEDAQDDSLMVMDMDDAPNFSPHTSFSFKPPTTTSSSNPLLSPGASITQATSLLRTSGRLPSPATSDDDRDLNTNLTTELENFGQMGTQLQGAQQDNHGKWRVPSGSGGRNLGHVSEFGMGGAKPRVQMGYRADCEKCVRRVPGHFMHIS